MSSPADVVQAQLDAYNERAIERFLAHFDDDIVGMSQATGQVLFSGIRAMRQSYTRLFENSPDLHAGLVSRLTMGNWIVDQEAVTGREGETFDAIATYQVVGNKIAKVWFAR